MQALRAYSLLVGAGIVLAGSAMYLLRGKGKSLDERERERRTMLNLRGRITDGTVIDVQEIEEGEIPTQLIIYQYDVAGVQYECSQDITWLRHFIDIHSCKLGLPASVKYDPHNPGNSIVICENWSGLRK